MGTTTATSPGVRHRSWRENALDHPRRLLLRRAILQVHLWSGLLVGLLATVVGVSGSAIVYGLELDRVLAPSLHHVSAGKAKPLEDMVARVAQANPGWQVVTADVGAPFDSWSFRLSREGAAPRTAYADPVSGEVLGARGEREGIVNWLTDLHIELLGGTKGQYVNGAGAVLLLLLSLTGVVVWWPGRKKVRRALRIHWRGRWPRVNWDAHTAGGFWISLPLALQAFSGVYLAFGLPVIGAVLVLLGGKAQDFTELVVPPRSAVVAAGHLPASLEGMLNAARARYPSATDIFIELPGKPETGVTAFVRTPSDIAMGGVSVLGFDRATGAVVKDVNSSGTSLALRTVLFLDAFHFGVVGGNVTKALWVLFGLTPGALFFSGLLMWWRRVGPSYWAKI